MTPAEIKAIMAASPAERNEMLRILEERELEQAGKPVDITPSVRDLLASAVRQMAAASDDPVALMAAMEAHERAAAKHLRRLRGRGPAPVAVQDLMAWCHPGHSDRIEAARLATEDGFPDPTVAPKPSGNPMGSDVPLGLLQRPATK